MFSLFKILLPNCSCKIEESIKIIVILVGLISIYITLNFYNSKLLRIIFIILGVVGLLSLLLFIFSGSFQALGLWGTIGLVVSLHALILPEIAIQLRKLKNFKKCCKSKLVKKNKVYKKK
jgi:hypothetical protein